MKKKNEAVETVLCERVLSAEEVACISVQIQQELEAYIDPVKREYLPRFFKTGKWQPCFRVNGTSVAFVPC